MSMRKTILLATTLALGTLIINNISKADDMMTGVATTTLYTQHCKSGTQVSAKTEKVINLIVGANPGGFTIAYAELTSQINQAIATNGVNTEMFWVLWCSKMESHIKELNQLS